MAYLGGGSDTAEAVLSGSIAAAFSPNVTAGSLMFAQIIWSDGGTNIECTGVSDSTGATWTLIGSVSNKDTIYGQRQRFAYSLNATAGAHTITATFNIQTQYRRIILAEYSGVATTAALDGYVAAFGTNTTAADNVTSGSITTTGPALILGGAFDAFNSTNTMAAGTGFTKRLEAGLTSIEDKTLASAGTVAATWTFGTAGRYLAGIVAFKTTGGSSSYAAAGTVAGTSAVSGSAVARLVAAGVVAALTTVTGSAGALLPSAGVVAATSGTSGSASVLRAAAGTVAATSGTSGAASTLLPAAGTVAATSGATGAAGVISGGDLAAAGTVAATSTVSGSAGVLAAAAGVVAVTATVTGSATAEYPAAGSVAATSALAGAATLLLPASGTVTVTATARGAAGVYSATGQRDVDFLGFDEQVRTVTYDETLRAVTFTERQRHVTTGEPMYLPRAGREFYDPGPTTDPALTGWEASFDGGTTWVAGTILVDRPRWLVRGPDFTDDGTPSVLIAATLQPVLRATDNPEVIVRNSPIIYLT